MKTLGVVGKIDTKSFKYVYFENSEIESFPEDFMEMLKGVEFLNANHVGLESVDGRSLGKLQNLQVFWGGENKIETLHENSFNENSKLEAIYLKFNQIRNIHPNAFRGLETLFVLDISSNNLKDLHPKVFDPLTQMVRLEISGNSIENLNKNIFYKLGNLIELKMMNNNLKHLNPDVFDPLKSLEYINISFNQSPLKRLRGELFQYNFNLKEIFLLRNRIEKIDRKFVNNYKPMLFYLALRMNECVDYDILLIEDGKIIKSEIEKLSKCF